MLSPWAIKPWEMAVGFMVEESLCGLTAESGQKCYHKKGEKEKCPKGFPGMKAKSVYKRKNLVAADWLSAQKRRMQA